MQAPRSRRAAGSTASSSMDGSRRCHHRHAQSTSENVAPPDPTGPSRFPWATTNLRSVPYRLDTPAPPTVTRRRRRLVSGSDESSLLIHSSECPADVESDRNPAATLPPRFEPHRPCQTGDPRYHRYAERADWFHIATQFASGCTPKNPRRASPTPATPYEISLRTSYTSVNSRRIDRVATLAAEQHARPLCDDDPTQPSYGSCGSKPALTDR